MSCYQDFGSRDVLTMPADETLTGLVMRPAVRISPDAVMRTSSWWQIFP